MLYLRWSRIIINTKKTGKRYLFNTYFMKGYCIIYFEHRNEVTNIVKLCLEITSRRRVFSVKLDYACDAISMFKINYTIAFHGISVL